MILSKTPQKIAYIDVMLFIYYFTNSPGSKLRNKALSFFQEIRTGKVMGVVTTFTINEFLAVMKKITSNNNKANPSQANISQWEGNFERFISALGITLYDADNLLMAQGSNCSFFLDCSQIIKDSDALLGSRDGLWHVLNGADSIHVLLAEKLNADLIVTNDDDFKGIKTRVRPCILMEAY